MSNKVIIAGGRDFNNSKELNRLCDFYLQNVEGVEIVSGLASGADKLGVSYADLRSLKLHTFKPDWKKLGKKAGIYRNEDMGNFSDFLIAFWDGKSPGTKHMIGYAHNIGLRVKVINYEMHNCLKMTNGQYLKSYIKDDLILTKEINDSRLFSDEETRNMVNHMSKIKAFNPELNDLIVEKFAVIK